MRPATSVAVASTIASMWWRLCICIYVSMQTQILLLLLPMSAQIVMVRAQAQALPKGFVSEIVGPSGSTNAVTGAFLPNPRRRDHRSMMLVVSKHGHVRVMENPDAENLDLEEEDEDSNNINMNINIDPEDNQLAASTTSNLVLDLSVEGKLCTNGERGLTSIAIHPNFLETRWVYLYYTRYTEGFGCLENDAMYGPRNVLVRYTMNSTTLLLEHEELLLELEIQRVARNTGGAMEFGTDGCLYLATGDGGMPHAVQDRTNLHGSLLRLSDDGSVPSDNPYAAEGVGVPCGSGISSGSGNSMNSDAMNSVLFCSEIYAWGFRNPIRMALHEKESNEDRVLFSISDVGAWYYEELNWAGTDYPAANYGWPQREGPCYSSVFPYSAGDNNYCSLPQAADSNSNSNRVVDAFHFYAHNGIGGGFVTGSAFVPEGIWPDQYEYLFIDFAASAIYSLREDPDAECRREECSPPSSGYANSTFYQYTYDEGGQQTNGAVRMIGGQQTNGAVRMIDMFFGPYGDTQALYVIQYGNTNTNNDDSILRIRYTGLLPPLATIRIDGNAYNDVTTTKPIILVQGQAFTPDGSGSFDPDGDELTFAWDFGDSATNSNDANTNTNTNTNTATPSHIYEVPGDYIVSLLVTDASDETNRASVVVRVIENESGMPPAVTTNMNVNMLSPLEGELFSWGQVLNLQAEAYDRDGNAIPDDQLDWDVHLLRTDGTVDSVLWNETTGNDVDIHLDHDHYSYSADQQTWTQQDSEYDLSVTLTARDAHGEEVRIVRELAPNVATVALATQPEGLSLLVNGVEVEAPYTVTAWVNLGLPLGIPKEQPPYKFQQWSDGNTDASRTLSIPPWTDDIATATRRQANDTAVSVSVTAVFCLDLNAFCSSKGEDEDEALTTDCCSGYCDRDGFCQEPQQQGSDVTGVAPNPTTKAPVSSTAYPAGMAVPAPSGNENEIIPLPSNGETTESDRKPKPVNSIVDETDPGQTSSAADSDETGNNFFKRFGPLGLSLLGLVLLWVVLTPIILGYKYIQLKRKLCGESKRSSSSKDIEKAEVRAPTAIESTVGDDETLPVFPFVEPIASCVSSLSSAGSSIWEKLSMETERRARLRAKYSLSSGTPQTPETIETKTSQSTTDSPTNLGVTGALQSPSVPILKNDSALGTIDSISYAPNADLSTIIDESFIRFDDDSCSGTIADSISKSPRSALATNIDDTLVRLDKLLSKTLTTNVDKTQVRLDDDSASGIVDSIATNPSAVLTTNNAKTLGQLDDYSVSSTIDSVAMNPKSVSTTNIDKTMVESYDSSASSAIDTIATSPSTALATHIDETLLRLDDLLSKTFSRRLSRSSRKQEQVPKPIDTTVEEQDRALDTAERGDTRAMEETSENPAESESNLAPLWHSSGHTTIPESPLREDTKSTALKADSPVSKALLYELEVDTKPRVPVPTSSLRKESNSTASKADSPVSKALLYELEVDTKSKVPFPTSPLKKESNSTASKADSPVSKALLYELEVDTKSKVPFPTSPLKKESNSTASKADSPVSKALLYELEVDTKSKVPVPTSPLRENSKSTGSKGDSPVSKAMSYELEVGNQSSVPIPPLQEDSKSPTSKAHKIRSISNASLTPSAPLQEGNTNGRMSEAQNSTVSKALLYELEADNNTTASILESTMQVDTSGSSTSSETSTSGRSSSSSTISKALLFELDAVGNDNRNGNNRIHNRSMASLYGFQGDSSNETSQHQVLKLSLFSDTSLLVFQDHDASSCATTTGDDVLLHASGNSAEDRMESGLLGSDGNSPKTTT